MGELSLREKIEVAAMKYVPDSKKHKLKELSLEIIELIEKEQAGESNKGRCCVCHHELRLHVDEKDQWRCHSLAADGFQCECRLSKDPMWIGAEERKIEDFDLQKRTDEMIKDLQNEDAIRKKAAEPKAEEKKECWSSPDGKHEIIMFKSGKNPERGCKYCYTSLKDIEYEKTCPKPKAGFSGVEVSHNRLPDVKSPIEPEKGEPLDSSGQIPDSIPDREIKREKLFKLLSKGEWYLSELAEILDISPRQVHSLVHELNDTNRKSQALTEIIALRNNVSKLQKTLNKSAAEIRYLQACCEKRRRLVLKDAEFKKYVKDYHPDIYWKIVTFITSDNLPKNDGEICTCPVSCDVPCKGKCGCKKCHNDYQDFLSEDYE